MFAGLTPAQLTEQSADSDYFAYVIAGTTPGYTDTAPFPATPTKWSYKAIYRKGDSQVGQWSAEVSVTVGG